LAILRPHEFTLGLGSNPKANSERQKIDIERHLQLNPNYFKANSNLGQLLKNGVRWAEAAEQFTQVLQRDPNHSLRAHAWWRHGFPIGRFSEAIFSFGKEQFSNSPNLLRGLTFGLGSRYLRKPRN